jgi:hypothetical protein
MNRLAVPVLTGLLFFVAVCNACANACMHACMNEFFCMHPRSCVKIQTSRSRQDKVYGSHFSSCHFKNCWIRGYPQVLPVQHPESIVFGCLVRCEVLHLTVACLVVSCSLCMWVLVSARVCACTSICVLLSVHVPLFTGPCCKDLRPGQSMCVCVCRFELLLVRKC